MTTLHHAFFRMLCLFMIVSVVFPSFANAEEFVSPSFVLQDSTIGPSGGYNSTSEHFSYYSSSSQIASGESTSTAFSGQGGIQYHLLPTEPVVTSVPVSSVDSGGGALALALSFSGKTSPGATVTLLKDSEIVGAVQSGSGGSFTMTSSGLVGGSYQFAVYATDTAGRRSSSVSIPLTVSSDTTSDVTGIFIPPMLQLNKRSVILGDVIAFSGSTVPGATIFLVLDDSAISLTPVITDAFGNYSLIYSSSELSLKTYTVNAQASVDNLVSGFGAPATFRVGTVTVMSTEPIADTIGGSRGDVNGDGRVDLVDFSIVAYWYLRPLEGDILQIEAKALNADGVIDLVDLSIMAFYWSG